MQVQKLRMLAKKTASVGLIIVCEASSDCATYIWAFLW